MSENQETRKTSMPSSFFFLYRDFGLVELLYNIEYARLEVQ